MEAAAERKAYKRQRLTEELQPLVPVSDPPSTPDKATAPSPDPVQQAEHYVQSLRSLSKKTLSSIERSQLRKAAHGLSEFAKKEDRHDSLVEAGAIQALVPLLTLFAPKEADAAPLVAMAEDIEKEACYILSLLANKNEFQLKMAEQGALTGLVTILKRYAPTVRDTRISNTGVSLIRRAADAITNMAHENVAIKTRVRIEDGIAPLVTLLEAIDIKIQKAAASALRTLAFKNEQNKDQIVQCGALHTLVHMLHAEDTGIHYEAVGVIGNLVHSSSHIKRSVLEIGALQPIIGLLSSKCQDAQREAALLIGQFATVDASYKAKIVQRGAVPPLVKMLGTNDRQLREMAAFAIGRVAQNEDNQAGIVQAGGLIPLLDLISSDDGNLQHNAAFALYGLADNADNISAFIREGSVQVLLGCQSNSQVQASRDCIQKTLKRLEEKVQGNVLHQALYLLHSPDMKVQQRCAIALAMLLKQDLKKAFVDRRGLEIIARMIKDGPPCSAQQKLAAVALYELANRAKAIMPLEGPPAPATGPNAPGLEHLKNGDDWDVVFLVEGQRLPAHRTCLQQASEAFRAMFAGNYLEKDALYIPIPNIRFEVFNAMIDCIYSGINTVKPDMAEELLEAADQYMLEGLKRHCEEELATQLTLSNVFQMYHFSRDAHAAHLGAHCVMYCLRKYDELCAVQSEGVEIHSTLQGMIPLLTDTIKEQLSRVAL